ncbi:hypothetical protein GRJ2_000353500 [Grus japonensis]|uniref:Uncharacterized protein n=1 Tax=Grus japonensis TaxID=30415 RepID=A0ABC9W472_GRUJA
MLAPQALPPLPAGGGRGGAAPERNRGACAADVAGSLRVSGGGGDGGAGAERGGGRAAGPGQQQNAANHFS